MSKYSPPKVAVISEFNPFHRGHISLLEKIRERVPDAEVCALMSGSFVQRGECAVYDKFSRAEAAVRCGYDLVLELPPPFSFGAAERFARGGVGIAHALGIFDYLAFGCTEDGEKLTLKAKQLASDEMETAVRKRLDEKKNAAVSYIETKSEVFSSVFGSSLPDSPNDMLALEYLSALMRLGSDISPLFVKRDGGWSATAARRAIMTGDTETAADMIPPQAMEVFSGFVPSSTDTLFPVTAYKLRTADPESFRDVADVGDGMENLISEAAKESTCWEEMYRRISGRRISLARARRTLLNCLFDVKKDDFGHIPSDVPLLASNARGLSMLKEIKHNSAVNVISRPAENTERFTAAADSMYALCCSPIKRDGWEKLKRVYIEKNEA